MSDEAGPWAASCALCLSCGKRWVAVYPTNAGLYFECPACGEMEGVRDDEDCRATMTEGPRA